MAKRGRKPKDAMAKTDGAAVTSNGYDKAMTQDFVDRVEEVQGEIDAIMEAARAKCSPKREDIAAIKKEATDAGLPRIELNIVLSRRRAARRIEQMRERLSGEQQDRLDNLEQALGMLGDLPLGEAAIRAAGGSAEERSELQ